MQSVHKETVELIPWYVNGTLTAEERDRLEVHLRECLPCRAALRDEQRLRGLIRAQDDIPIGAEHGMSDLLRRIERSGARAASSWFRTPLGYGATAIAAAIVAWVALTNLPTRDSIVSEGGAVQTGEPGGAFTTLTDGEAAAVNRIDLILADAVAENTLADILDALGGELIGGPSELGRYTVAVEAQSEDELSAVIDRLLQDPRVRFAGRSYSGSPSNDSGAP